MSGLDVTTLVMAVDSTRVTTATAELDKMAAAGTKAETAAGRLTRAAADNGKTLAGAVAPAAAKAALSFKSVAEAAQALGPGAAAKLAGAFGAAEAQAQAATRAVQQLRTEVALVGAVPAPTIGLRGAVQQRDTEEQARRQLDPRLAGASALGAAAAKANAQVGALGKTAQLTAFQTQQLGFQVHDFVVQVASGQSPITAFVQQGSQLSGTFGGAGNAFRAVTSLITPFRLAVGGAAAAVGALAFAIYDGQKRSKDFGDALQLSGNYAGQTEGQFNALAIAVSKSKQATVGTVREIAEALLKSGEIGPQVFDAATQAAVGYAQATGKTAEEVAKDFGLMARSPTKFAAEANRQLNFITAAQYASIKGFEEAGRAADAQGVIIDALNVKFPKLGSHLNALTRWLSETQTAWTRMWASAVAPATIEDRISQVAARLAGLQQAGPNRTVAENAGGAGFVGPSTGRASVASLAAAEVSLADLRRRQFRQTENAAAAAFKAEAEKAAIAADSVVDGYLRRGKAAATYKQKLDELNRSFLAKEIAGVPVSAGDKSIAIAELRKEFTARGGARGNEAGQVALARAEGDEKRIQSLLDDRTQAFSYAERFLQGAYQAGELSLADYFDHRRGTIAAGAEAEIAALEEKRARYVALLKDPAFKDPSQREVIKNKIDDVTDREAKLRAAAAEAATLANQEETASFKALNVQVLNYRANLLQMQGDETGAAKVRAQIAAEQLRVLARQSVGSANPITADDERAATAATAQVDRVNAAKTRTSQLNQLLATEEDHIALVQSKGAIGEIDALKMAGAARARYVEQLQDELEKLEKLAKERPLDVQLKIDIAQAELAIAKLKTEIDPLKKVFDDTLKGAGANLFTDLMNGTKPKNALKSFFNSIGGEINTLVGKQLSQQVFGEGKILGGGGGFLASVFGGKDRTAAAPSVETAGVQQAFAALRAAGIDPATSALARLQAAADGAAGSIGRDQSGTRPALTTGDFARFDRGQTGESAVAGLFRDARRGSEQLGENTAEAASALLQFAQAATKGQGALSQLPNIIAAIQAASAAASGGSSGGGIFGKLIGSPFGSAVAGPGDAGWGMDLGFEHHTGGIVGRDGRRRAVVPGAFAAVGRYHAGGVVRGAGTGRIGLAVNEVPAILMGGPRGVREEVLTADDPRHRDRLTPEMAGALGVPTRYHSGGIAGLRPDRATDALKPVRNPYLTMPAKPAAAPVKGGGDELHVHVTAAPGVTREQAMNQGRDIGRAIQLHGNKRARNT